jgi:hypothetical protein
MMMFDVARPESAAFAAMRRFSRVPEYGQSSYRDRSGRD